MAEGLAAHGFFAHARHRTPGTRPHRQPGVEVHALAEGRARVRVGDETLVQTPHDLLVFDATRAHSVTATGVAACTRNVLCLSAAGAREWGLAPLLRPRGVVRLRPDAEALDALQRCLVEAGEEQVTRGEGWAVMGRSLAARTCVGILRLACVEPLRGGGRGFDRPGGIVERAGEHVRQHLHVGPTLASTAAALHVSEEHLTRSFRAARGVPFARYVLRQRIEAACRRLAEEPSASIGTVAADLGFGSHAAFTRAFQRVLGESPTSWRRRRTG